MLLTSIVIAVLGTIVVASCGCLPGYILFIIIYILFLLLVDLLNLSASNAGISGVRDASFDAQREIREMLVDARRCGSPRSELVTELEEHDRVLGSYLEADRFRARFLGFIVDYGVARTLVVTIFTVSVGLWSVLRGLGVTFTMSSFCFL
jgi:hypothetical protein